MDEKAADGTLDARVAPWVAALPGRPTKGSTVIAISRFSLSLEISLYREPSLEISL